MIRVLILLVFVSTATAAEPLELKFEDQFDAKVEMKSARGKVLVLVYGDRKASDECRKLGEKLHGSVGGKQVQIQAVAYCGKMPKALRPLLRSQIAKVSPEIPVWLDFEETMVTSFGITTGQANVAVFDRDGRYRHLVNGTLDQKKLDELTGLIGKLRDEDK